MQRVIVPIDGSDHSWRAVDIGLTMARRLSVPIDIVQVVADPSDTQDAQHEIDRMLMSRALADLEVQHYVELFDGPAAAAIAAMQERRPEATLVMASHGRGRSAAVVGSVTDDVLRRTFGPVLVVGPHVTSVDLDGPILVPVDGSHESEAALPLAAAWGIEVGAVPWIVHVSAPTSTGRGEVMESAYVARLAHDLAATSGHEVEFEELHGGHPESSLPDYAQRVGASVIVATTHARTGLARLTSGSTTSGFVRHATCPVLVHRLPHRSGADEADNAHAAAGPASR